MLHGTNQDKKGCVVQPNPLLTTVKWNTLLLNIAIQ